MSDDDPLSGDEIHQVRELLEIADLVKSEARYRAAVRLVLKTWKGTIVAIGAAIIGVLLFWEQVKLAWASLVN